MLRGLTADEFNAAYAVGTKVKYHPIIDKEDGVETRTRSEAWTLGSGQAVVKVEGKAGGVSLDALTLL